jgi:spore coat protein CotH
MSLDKKPSFTLKFGPRDAGGGFQGLRRIHLNNSVQDSTYLNDYLTSELFRRVNVPSACTAWAKVRLNDRDLGLYVLKEHMGAEFLARFFKDTAGNFYDGGLHRDINEALVLDSGTGPTRHADLVSLYDTTQIASRAERWPKLRGKLDVDRFISMMAMEILTCDVDGYSLMQNNYRIYFDPSSKRAVFIVHGLDRTFEEIDLPLEPAFRGVVSRAILDTPEGRKRYRQQLADLADKHFQPEWITNRIEQVIRLLEPAEPLMAAPAHALTQRIVKRAETIRTNLKQQRFQ